MGVKAVEPSAEQEVSMTMIRLMTAALLAATSTAALAQDSGQPDHNVNRNGTIGPTITANPPNSTDAVPASKDPDVGQYGVPGGVGDPSVGSNLTGTTARLLSAPSSLRSRTVHERRRTRR